MSPGAVRVRALPVLALLLGAVETVLVRSALDHRPVGAGLFVQATLLWGALLLLAWIPAALVERCLRRGAGEVGARAPLGSALWLLFCAVAPVVAHNVLDRFTLAGADASALLALRPWIEVLVAVGVLAAVLLGLGRALANAPRWPLAIAVCALSLVAGLFAPGGAASPATQAGGGATSRPNLLLLVWDTARAASVQPFDADRETTPHLARLAAESVVYTNARAASTFTFTSHLSMLSGAYPSHHGARMLDSRYRRSRAEHVAALLREAGYRTGGFVGTAVLSGGTGINFGFEVWDDQVDPPVCDTRAWGLIHDVQSVVAKGVPALRFNGLPHWIQDFQRPAAGPLQGALDWIGEDDPRPWFCFVNVYDAHWPYLPGEQARSRLVRDYEGPMDGYVFRSDAYEEGYAPGSGDDRHLADLYEAELWELDRQVDAFLREVGLDGVSVVLTSDHGEAFGEGGEYEHDDVLEPQLRVPMLVRAAAWRSQGGRVSHLPVSGVDVAPTLLGLAGLDVPEGMDGVDLARGAPAADRAVLSEDRDHLDPKDIRLVLARGRWRLEVLGMGEERRVMLHDLDSDSVGEVDVGDANPDVRAELLVVLDAMRASWGGDEADAAPTTGGVFDADGLGALGYTDGDPDLDAEPERP